jgi:methylmalonyl-CoA/ethylmalonyl-CoA epimerase
MEFHHIGHATKSINTSSKIFSELGYSKESDPIEDDLIDVKIEFWKTPFGPRMEFVQPISDNSAVWKILVKRGGPYHYGYLVPEISEVAARLRKKKVRPISDAMPAVAFNGRYVQFFAGPDGSVIELINKF